MVELMYSSSFLFELCLDRDDKVHLRTEPHSTLQYEPYSSANRDLISLSIFLEFLAVFGLRGDALVVCDYFLNSGLILGLKKLEPAWSRGSFVGFCCTHVIFFVIKLEINYT